MNQGEFVKRVERQAEGLFASLNTVTTVTKASSSGFEVRVSPRAFHYHAVFIINEREMSSVDLLSVFEQLESMRAQMIENAFTHGYAPKAGYPKDFMDPAQKKAASF